MILLQNRDGPHSNLFPKGQSQLLQEHFDKLFGRQNDYHEVD